MPQKMVIKHLPHSTDSVDLVHWSDPSSHREILLSFVAQYLTRFHCFESNLLWQASPILEPSSLGLEHKLKANSSPGTLWAFSSDWQC